MSPTLPLSAQVFAILSALIEERTGLHYELHERELLGDRVSARAIERGFETLLDYYYLLRYDPAADAEFAKLVEALVVNETYFFRETAALERVVSHVVPELLESGVRPRIWCAACATGEEPLTLAMMLDQAGCLDAVSLVATDISERALTQAHSGIYRRRSLRALPPGVMGRWLEEVEDGVRVSPRLYRAVDWQRLNLNDERELTQMGQFDVIICRNVLIYFSDKTVERIASNMWHNLRPGGRLIVGASESLLRFDVPFTCEEQGGAFFYRKVEK